jgi:hypothetical protein
MPTNPVHLTDLIKTCDNTGRRYIALSLANALKATVTANGATNREMAQAAAAKVEWEDAEWALSHYQPN